MSNTIKTSVAKLLQESTGNPANGAIVMKYCYEAALQLANNIHAHMIAFIAKTNKESIKATLGRVTWSTIPAQIQDRYSSS